MVADLVQLTLADAGEREREEHQQHILDAAEAAQRDGLTILVLESEVRRLGTGFEH